MNILTRMVYTEVKIGLKIAREKSRDIIQADGERRECGGPLIMLHTLRFITIYIK